MVKKAIARYNAMHKKNVGSTYGHLESYRGREGSEVNYTQLQKEAFFSALSWSKYINRISQHSITQANKEGEKKKKKASQ